MKKNIINELKDFSDHFLGLGEFRIPTQSELDFYQKSKANAISAMYLPHENQYQPVLQLINPEDIIIDMGAGDFRLPLLLSQKAKKVYAVELNPELVSKTLDIIKYDLPSNLIIICADWFNLPIPNDVNIIICLCNSPEIPESWHNYKRIIGTTAGISIIGATAGISIINKEKRGERIE